MRRKVQSIKSSSTKITARQIGMVQVDIVGHSQMSEVMAPKLVMEAKHELFQDLKRHLDRLRCLTWAGDGGIFWIECLTEEDFDSVVAAGETAFRVLSSVNALFADRFPGGRKMALRVSGHFGLILTVPDPRFWHGKELNFFAKHERELSEPGMFGITKNLRDTLSQTQREKFPESRRVTRVIGNQEVEIYFHQGYGEIAPFPPQRKTPSSQRQSPALQPAAGLFQRVTKR